MNFNSESDTLYLNKDQYQFVKDMRAKTCLDNQVPFNPLGPSIGFINGLIASTFIIAGGIWIGYAIAYLYDHLF